MSGTSGDGGMDKIRRVCAELETRGLAPLAVAPLAFRLLWRTGVALPPPLYLPFAALALGSGALFALLWGGLMWLLVWSQAPSLFTPALVWGATIASGVLFGLAFAGFVRWKARRLRLPRWSEA